MLQKCFTKIPLVAAHQDKCHFIGFQTVFVSFLTLQSVIFLFCYKLFFLKLLTFKLLDGFSNLKRFKPLIEIPDAYSLLRISFKKTKSRIFQRFEIFRSAFFLI